jgi:cellulose synthase/poly-beta-1,6-N-acetylglucosamine synthase-like glycosyltransferase
VRRLGFRAFLVASALAAARYGFILLAGGPREADHDEADLRAVGHATVLVVAHNEGSVIAETVLRVLSSRHVDISIVVADDGSTDETVALCTSVAAVDERVTVLRLPRRGKVPTVRAALAAVDSEWVVTVDADTLVDVDCVARLVQAMTSRGLAACAGNMYVRPERPPVARVQALEYIVLNGDRSALGRWSAVSILPGALTCWRLADLHQLMQTARSVNDIDLTFAALDAGLKIGFAPDAVGRTMVPTTIAGAANQRRRWGRRKINRSPAILFRFLQRSTPCRARLAYGHLLVVHTVLALVGWWIELWLVAVAAMTVRGKARPLLGPTVGTYALLTSLSIAVYRRDACAHVTGWWLVGASWERLTRGMAALSVVVFPERNTASWQPARQPAIDASFRARRAVP